MDTWAAPGADSKAAEEGQETADYEAKTAGEDEALDIAFVFRDSPAPRVVMSLPDVC